MKCQSRKTRDPSWLSRMSNHPTVQHLPVCTMLTTILHYRDIMMSAMVSKFTGIWTVFSAISFVQVHIKENIKALSLAFVRGIHRCSVDSPHKGPVTRKMFPFDDVIKVNHFSFKFLWLSVRLNISWLIRQHHAKCPTKAGDMSFWELKIHAQENCA